MTYKRVIPRDLFNEAKLLKCLGQLSLLIHEGKGISWPMTLEHEDEDEGFIIDQNSDSGSIFVVNLNFFVGERLVDLVSPFNSKAAYPLHFVTEDEEDRVFNEDGSLSAEFVAMLDSVVAD